jgi:predicted CXXCH cytochrome family protein
VTRRDIGPRRTARWWVLMAVAITAAAGLWRLRATRPAVESAASTPSSRATPSDATYVGADACASCHRDAYNSWRGSQHDLAMQPANSTSVKGRFDGGEFRYDGVISRFFQRDRRYWVRTDGADGSLADFDIKYTFGIYPLQQYLIEQPGGRLQALSIAWDARAKSAGGQRWLHLYPGQHIRHGDELHWTGRQQNWNFMCADCHSTNLRKKYDPATDSFQTTWSEINVACEACHGPGSKHVEWARSASASSSGRSAVNGLTVELTERRDVGWSIDPNTLKPVRSKPRTTAREIDTCAPCHSRRAQIADGYTAGAPLLDFYLPATLEPPLYFADGQQRDEVYNYGSFLQSRMAHAGVTCSDCHEPHAATMRADGNALCARCHAASRYDAPQHHHHKAGGAGAACVACHMPARTYMQIDARRDHSLRVPRPDLSQTTGAPNACATCHANRSVEWSAAAVKGWLGRNAVGFQQFASAFHDSEIRRPGAGPALLALATSGSQPPIVRASAFARLAEAPPPASAVASGLTAADPLVRHSALRALENASTADRLAVIPPLLSDPIRAVRIAAARLLAASAGQLGGHRAAFDRAASELVASARFNGDRPESRVTLAVFLADQGKTDEAQDEYRAAIRLGPDFVPAHVNLADLLRTTGREAEAERVLRDGLARTPSSAELQYALGLSLTRSHRAADAIAAFKRASDLAPEVARFAYAYALALKDNGQTAAAVRALASALTRHPDDRDMLFALATFERDSGHLAAAREHAARLRATYPDDDEARALFESLRERR